MQLTPEHGQYIARLSGGTQFTVDDLATPQVNIAYGAYYLRYLLRATTATRRSRWPPITRARVTSIAGSRRRRRAGFA